MPNDEDIAITTLEHSDCLCYIRLSLTGSQLEKMATVMTKPFPLLTSLIIHSMVRDVPVLPGGFLGGSAPCLQEVDLHGVPFPALPTLLLSTSNLITLTLSMIPPTGYISPESMVACLAVLPNLKIFTIDFLLATPHPDQIRLPPKARTVLPALTSFNFQGAYEYLKDLIAQIDSPHLNLIGIDYLDQPDDFQVTQLSKIIDRIAL